MPIYNLVSSCESFHMRTSSATMSTLRQSQPGMILSNAYATLLPTSRTILGNILKLKQANDNVFFFNFPPCTSATVTTLVPPSYGYLNSFVGLRQLKRKRLRRTAVIFTRLTCYGLRHGSSLASRVAALPPFRRSLTHKVHIPQSHPNSSPFTVSTLLSSHPKQETSFQKKQRLFCFLLSIGKSSPSTRHCLEAPFTLDELRSVLKRSRELSAPGVDGVTYPLLAATGDAALKRLCNLANALLRGHQLPEGEPMLRGVMLPKKANLSNLANYRPLAIAATAFRVLGAAVAQRLQPATQEMISANQTGFILGRHSARNVITLYLLHHAVQFGKVQGPIWMLNLDQQKAYDRVQREWLIDCLAAYGFGPRFLTYIKSIYRHPSMVQSMEGFNTEPIRLECGILQGDPMSCLLYNFSLQPMLDYAQQHHHAGMVLDWDSAHPLFVSSLAFADDVLLVVNNHTDLGKFMDALDLYEMASNAKVNEDKSQAFLFARGANLDDDSGPTADDIPFPVLGQTDAEIIHLGYPFRLDGGIPVNTIEKRLASIQTKVNILTATETTLLARARICNTLLLSRIWHTLRLCPISNKIQHRVNAIINPLVFKGRRSWIKHEYVVAPQHLGGLGVIDTNDMSLALLGQLVANLLANTEPIGCQFRQALQDHLWSEYGALPAHFILRRGKPWIAMVSGLTAQKSFMCRVVYTLTQLRLTVEPDWDDITVSELLALPFHNDMYGYKWAEINVANTQSWERNGLRVWGDYLWYNPNEKGVIAHDNAIPAAFPLVPPSPAGIKNNYVASRGHPENKALFSDAAGRILPKLWREIWSQLNPTVADKLLDISKRYGLHPDNSKSKKNPKPHDRPFKIDTVGLPFPWRLVMLAGKPIAQYTVRMARAYLASPEPIIPDWPLESTAAQWRLVWAWHTQDSILTSAARSDVFLFLHRRPWLAQKPRGERRLANYGELNEPIYAPRVLMRDCDIAEAERNPQSQPCDPYEAEHVFGVAHCMLCEGANDSAAHGYVECTHIQREVWNAAMPTLRKLVNGRGVPTDTRNIVLGWPDLRMPAPFRARLLLWRDLVIHLLARKREAAISSGLKEDHRPRFKLINFLGEHSALVARTLADTYHQCAPSKKGAFVAKWIDQGAFLKEINGTLEFYSMQRVNTPSNPSNTLESHSMPRVHLCLNPPT